MTDINLKLIKLIEEGKTINEITDELKMSNKQILRRLNDIKMDGINYFRNYQFTGDITFELNKTYNNGSKNITNIKMKKEDEFKAVIISDLHIGSELERLDLMYKVYDYCINNNVHIIINAGDLVEGMNNYSFVEKEVYLNQIEHLLKDHPYDKNILNFICLGNHDVDSLRKDGINLAKILLNNRFDLVPIGFGKGILKIKNDFIYVLHPTAGVDLTVDTNNLILRGHSHKLKKIYENNQFTFYVPSLSDIKQVGSSNVPTFLELNIKFSNGLFKKGYISTLIIQDKIYKFCEIQLDFDYNQNNYKIKKKS